MDKKQYTKTSVHLPRLQQEIEAAAPGLLKYLETVGDKLNVYFNSEPDSSQLTSIDSAVTGHSGTLVDDIARAKVDAALIFGSQLMADFAVENVTMGITQAGKSGDVLAVMEDKVVVPTSTRPVSAMSAIQSGTLYTACDVIDYHIANINDYSDLSPFITADRLTEIKQKILDFLAS